MRPFASEPWDSHSTNTEMLLTCIEGDSSRASISWFSFPWYWFHEPLGKKKLAEREAVLVWALTWSQPREGNGALQSPTQEQGRAPGQWQNTLQCLVFYTKSSCKHIWVSPALQDFKSSFPSLPKLLLSKEWTRHWSCFSQRLLGIKLLRLQVGSTWGHRREACLLLCTWACARCLLSPQRMMLLELPQLYLSSPWGMEIGRWIETTRQKENLSGKQWIFQDAQGKFFGL